MKKAIILIVVFSILAITFTLTMININKANYYNSIKNNSKDLVSNDKNTNFVEDSSEIIPSTEKNIERKNEKTLDLYSTYDENDLKIEYTDVTDSNFNIKDFNIPKISGLKNKEVENKINSDIEKGIMNFAKDIFTKNNILEANALYDIYNNANFANVLSINYGFRYELQDTDYIEKRGFNYELISGNKLELKDLFSEDIGVNDVVRRTLYRFLEQRKQEDVPYVNDMNDYDIEKLVKKEYSSEDFYFSSTNLFIILRPEYNRENEIVEDGVFIGNDYEHKSGIARYCFKDMADYVTIYNKYLTTESIFERSDIGRKNLVTCTEEKFAPKEKQAFFVSDNYFYDYTPFFNKYTYTNDTYSSSSESGYPEIAINNINVKMKEIIDYYKNVSEENKDKAYFLFVYPFKGDGRLYGRIFFETKLITCDIKDKKTLMNQIFGNVYRYHNLGFYGTLLYNLISLSEPMGEYGSIIIECDSANLERKGYYYTYEGNEIVGVNTVILNSEDLWNESEEELTKMYNEPFARHGHDFQSKELKDYFSEFEWYKPIKGKKVSLEELNEIERENIALIKAEIDKR